MSGQAQTPSPPPQLAPSTSQIENSLPQQPPINQVPPTIPQTTQPIQPKPISTNIIKNSIAYRNQIDALIDRGLIQIVSSNENKFMKLLELTDKGEKELISPGSDKLKSINKKTIITSEDLEKFKELDNLLGRFNNSQKKAIISDKAKILCIAGAGSGKTTVLTKRIEFLVKYRNINPEKILAITFTRKARDEMQERLTRLHVNAKVETFNSFCEKLLLKYNNQIYKRQVRVITYQHKIMMVMSALENINSNLDLAVNKYFSSSQIKNKNHEQLVNILMNDCFFILEYFKIKNQELYDFSKDAWPENKETAKMIYQVCKYIKEQMNLQGLRDYTDQILDVVKFFKENKQMIPEFDHILVDEYQDVNASQIELLDLLNTKNIFAVGDPRQSIFGWRGSDIKYILNFENKYPDSEIIVLTKNYRSNNHLVDLMNNSIKELGLPDLESNFSEEKEISLLNFDSDESEMQFVIEKILSSNLEKEQIFVLSRTNQQLAELSKKMKILNINHIIKNDEVRSSLTAEKGQVTLATIHSIKGLEAKMVFIIGANEQNFPCKASDHPVIELIKIDEYDKEDEEKRLFYVAISRAKNKLYMTYTGKKPTSFINSEMLKIIHS